MLLSMKLHAFYLFHLNSLMSSCHTTFIVEDSLFSLRPEIILDMDGRDFNALSGIHHRRTLPKVPSSAHCYAHVRTHPRSERYAAVKSIILGETPALVEQPPLEPPAAWNPKDCKKSRSRHNSALQLKRCVFIFYVLIAKGGEPRQVQELQEVPAFAEL